MPTRDVLKRFRELRAGESPLVGRGGSCRRLVPLIFVRILPQQANIVKVGTRPVGRCEAEDM
jgi:hypothetical protein